VQFGYGLNYLIDIENAMIVDVEATPARTYDEVAATQTMLERTQERFDLKPKRLAADMAYGTGKFLGWQVKIKKIIPHIPVARRTKACRDALHAFEDPSWLRADAAQGTFRGTRRIPFSRHRAEPQNAGAPDPSAATNAISRIVRLNSHMDHSSFPSESIRSKLLQYQPPAHLSQMRQPRKAVFRRHRSKTAMSAVRPACLQYLR
jgi:Transposase DDE domain